MKVAIVGGGAAGLSACRHLVEAGHHPTIFDITDGIGGMWMGKSAAIPTLYESLVTNLPHQAMQFHELPFDESSAPSSYRRGDDMLSYLKKYATKYDIKRHTRTSTKVLSAGYVEQSSKWKVKTVDVNTNNYQTTVFDAVVVANGHYSEPFIPQIKGLQEWLENNKGNLIHSHQYREPSPYKGKTVLIAGASFSGNDITESIHKVAKQVIISDLRHSGVVSKTNRVLIPAKKTYISLSGHIINDGVTISEHPVTDIILASGYKYSFPFLDLPSLGIGVTRMGKFVSGLDSFQLFPTKLEVKDSICFMGLQTAIVPFPLFESQARYIAAVFSGTANLVNVPTKEYSVAPNTHILGPNQWSYVLDLDNRSHHKSDKNTRRVHTVKEIFEETVSSAQRLSTFLGDRSEYRNAVFTVDWETGKWNVEYKTLAKL